MTYMEEDTPLFGFADSPETAAATGPEPIASWQIDLLRKVLDARGVTEMDERRAVIVRHAGRRVESLKALTYDEGVRVLAALGEQSPSRTSSGSAWDERDEDTWIDRI